MTDISKYPERVGRKVAMELLCVRDKRAFKRVVDATPELTHKLPGEQRAKYLVRVIARLLLAGVRPTGEEHVKRGAQGAKRGALKNRTERTR